MITLEGTGLLKKSSHTKQYSVLLDSETIKMAEKEIIRSVQRRQFGEELISLGKESHAAA